MKLPLLSFPGSARSGWSELLYLEILPSNLSCSVWVWSHQCVDLKRKNILMYYLNEITIAFPGSPRSGWSEAPIPGVTAFWPLLLRLGLESPVCGSEEEKVNGYILMYYLNEITIAFFSRLSKVWLKWGRKYCPLTSPAVLGSRVTSVWIWSGQHNYNNIMHVYYVMKLPLPSLPGAHPSMLWFFFVKTGTLGREESSTISITVLWPLLLCLWAKTVNLN